MWKWLYKGYKKYDFMCYRALFSLLSFWLDMRKVGKALLILVQLSFALILRHSEIFF